MQLQYYQLSIRAKHGIVKNFLVEIFRCILIVTLVRMNFAIPYQDYKVRPVECQTRPRSCRAGLPNMNKRVFFRFSPKVFGPVFFTISQCIRSGSEEAIQWEINFFCNYLKRKKGNTLVSSQSWGVTRILKIYRDRFLYVSGNQKPQPPAPFLKGDIKNIAVDNYSLPRRA